MDEVDVWHLRLDGAARIAHLEATLSDDERSRAARFHRDVDRARFIVAHGWLREVLSGYIGREASTLTFAVDPLGKPSLLRGGDLRFSLSRSGGRAVVAVARGREVGVDIERVRPGPAEELASSGLLAPPERQAIAALPMVRRRAAFFACWTRKEAYLKATGQGLRTPLHSFSVSVVPGEARISLVVPGDPAEAARWRLVELEVDSRHAASLAAEGHDWQPRIRRPTDRAPER